MISALAIGLATKFIPELIGRALNSKEAEEVTGAVMDLAKVSAGGSLEKLEAKLNNEQDLQLKLRNSVNERLKLKLEDVQHARETLVNKPADKLTWAILIMNFLIIIGAIAANIFVTTLSLTDGQLMAVGAVLGAALTHAYQSWQQIMNYRYGASLKEHETR